MDGFYFVHKFYVRVKSKQRRKKLYIIG